MVKIMEGFQTTQLVESVQKKWKAWLHLLHEKNAFRTETILKFSKHSTNFTKQRKRGDGDGWARRGCGEVKKLNRAITVDLK